MCMYMNVSSVACVLTFVRVHTYLMYAHVPVLNFMYACHPHYCYTSNEQACDVRVDVVILDARR